MIAAGAVNHASLPVESFVELAFELRLIARDRVADAESVEQLIARLEVRMERDPTFGDGIAPSFTRVRLDGCRDALAELQRRAAFAARAAEMFGALAAREEEVRRIFVAAPPQAPAPRKRRWISGLFHFSRRPPDV